MVRLHYTHRDSDSLVEGVERRSQKIYGIGQAHITQTRLSAENTQNGLGKKNTSTSFIYFVEL